MKFKLDENMDPRSKGILVQAGHNVIMIQEEGLSGAPDADVIEVARDEGRCFITLDLDFADVLAFPPKQYPGIIVLRHPKPTTKRFLDLVRQLAQILQTESPEKKLWIVEPGRLRVHEEEKL
jgi:predicted nuclease of predicted toxin-antitoxin system